MNTAFEDFVTVALSRALAPFGGRCQPQDQSHPMDRDGNVKLRPDLVRYGSNGAPQAVIDAKYKAEAPSGFPYADLYQLLAYCTATKLKIGHLVYAEGGDGDHDVVVRNAGIVIRRHVLDLQQPVSELHAQVALLARIIAHP
jgi:5-methylcytosine-specific restriction enzyme subunit McrC